MNFRIVSYYTRNTSYELEAKKLMESLEKLGLPYEVEVIDTLGSWQKNTHYKAIFIRRMMEKHDEDVVFLDADCVVRRYPKLFDEINAYEYVADIAVHYFQGKQLASGTLYFANCPFVQALVDSWIEENKKNPNGFDQKNLQNVLERGWKNLTVFHLPPEYCKIFDLMADVKDPVIEHFQASRRLKEEVNGNN